MAPRNGQILGEEAWRGLGGTITITNHPGGRRSIMYGISQGILQGLKFRSWSKCLDWMKVELPAYSKVCPRGPKRRAPHNNHAEPVNEETKAKDHDQDVPSFDADVIHGGSLALVVQKNDSVNFLPESDEKPPSCDSIPTQKAQSEDVLKALGFDNVPRKTRTPMKTDVNASGTGRRRRTQVLILDKESDGKNLLPGKSSDSSEDRITGLSSSLPLGSSDSDVEGGHRNLSLQNANENLGVPIRKRGKRMDTGSKLAAGKRKVHESPPELSQEDKDILLDDIVETQSYSIVPYKANPDFVPGDLDTPMEDSPVFASEDFRVPAGRKASGMLPIREVLTQKSELMQGEDPWEEDSCWCEEEENQVDEMEVLATEGAAASSSYVVRCNVWSSDTVSNTTEAGGHMKCELNSVSYETVKIPAGRKASGMLPKRQLCQKNFADSE